MARVLLVDDEPDFVAAATEMLQMHSHEVATAQTLSRAREMLDKDIPDVLLLDLMLPDGNGLELLEETVRELKRVVLITGHPGIKSHIRDLSGPSVSYLTKPIDGGDLVRLCSDIDVEQEQERAERREGDPGPHFGFIIGEHPKMHAVYEQIEKVARTDTPVLVVGETGTGKELVAQSIHHASERSGDFVAVNCGSLSRELAGSELFGHEKGSFTGAVRRHLGFFKRADAGTLFLDELTEMPMELQPHFLRVLETGSVLPVGSEKETTVQTRVVAATNREPTQAITENILRQDLYFRLSVFPILLPPLRDRASDIPLLVGNFIRHLDMAGRARSFSDAAMSRLQAYRWPGNVRELRHVVQRAFIMTDEDATDLELPERFDSPFGAKEPQRGLEAGRSIRDVERELIERTLTHFDGDKKAAAETLGISLNTLYNRLNAYQTEGS
jgi:two-component system, NtrC family, response regulator HydG